MQTNKSLHQSQYVGHRIFLFLNCCLFCLVEGRRQLVLEQAIIRNQICDICMNFLIERVIKTNDEILQKENSIF